MSTRTRTHQAYARAPAKRRRNPVRTTVELAKEFGITQQKLCQLLKAVGAPQPVSRTARAKWFDYPEVKKWYQGVKV